MAREKQCARKGCRNPVPKAALLHNDKFCSTVCFRAHFGTLTEEEAAESLAAAERGAGAADKGGWRRASQASFERAYGRGVRSQ